MNRDNLLSSLAAVCNIFYRKKFRTDEEPKLWLAPAAGMIPGAAAAVVGSALVFLLGHTGGGIMTAIFIPVFLEFLTGWRGLETTVAFLDRLLSGRKGSGFVPSVQGRSMQTQVLFASVYLFRMAVFGLLASCGGVVWYLYALGGSYLIRGELLSPEDSLPKEGRFFNWILFGAGSLAGAVLSFHWSAFASLPIALIVTALLLTGCRRYLAGDRKPMDFSMVEFFGYLSENLLLAVGLILSGGEFHG